MHYWPGLLVAYWGQPTPKQKTENNHLHTIKEGTNQMKYDKLTEKQPGMTWGCTRWLATARPVEISHYIRWLTILICTDCLSNCMSQIRTKWLILFCCYTSEIAREAHIAWPQLKPKNNNKFGLPVILLHSERRKYMTIKIKSAYLPNTSQAVNSARRRPHQRKQHNSCTTGERKCFQENTENPPKMPDNMRKATYSSKPSTHSWQ